MAAITLDEGRRDLPRQGLPPQRAGAHHDARAARVHPPLLLHVLPKGFHRIRHYGLPASAGHKANLARARDLLAAPQPEVEATKAMMMSMVPPIGGRHARAAAGA
jgi:hypothetical protein